VTKGLRWRIVSLQVIVVLALGFCAGFLYWGSSFVNGMVHDQLVAQKISFPPASQVKARRRASTRPSSRPRSGTTPASRWTTATGPRVYANDFIGIHLAKVANGQTYSQVSAAAQADPKNATLAGQVKHPVQGRDAARPACSTRGAGRRSACTPSTRAVRPDDRDYRRARHPGVRDARGAAARETATRRQALPA